MKIALVHDWLTGMRGGEKVLAAFSDLYPQADLFTLLHVRGSVSPALEQHRVRTSLLQRVPLAGRAYRYFLPVFPALVELFDLDGYDLIISTSHCAAKSVIRPGRARHLCYCHTPMRYVWDQREAYFGRERVGRLPSAALRPVLAALARWDAGTAGRVDCYVANSRHVAARIRGYYNHAATVVYPPVDTAFYHPDGAAPERFMLVVSALVPYKRIDIAINACRRVGIPLRIVGQGGERARLQALAGPDVEFLGARTDEDVRALYRRAAAVLMPGEEDFGIVAVEAQACGRPVVALGRGGATETVVDGTTGVLAGDGAAAFEHAIARALEIPFDPSVIRTHALQFGRDRFRREIQARVDELLGSV